MDNIEINLNEISPIEDMKIDENKLQDVCVSFGEVIYVDKEDITDHDKLKNLDYEHSGHIGFASSEALSNVDERVKSLEEIGIPEDGLTPYIGENGNWFIGEEDTGVQAEGQDGKDGVDGVDGVGIETITQGEPYEKDDYTITPITFTKSNDIFHTFGVKAKNGKSENLELYATKEYVEGLNESTNEEIESAKTIAQEYTNQKVEELNAEIVKKANQSDMETALSKKAEITYVDNKVSQEVSSVQADFNNYKSTNDSAVKANSDAIGILNGNSITEGSVDYKVNKAINEFAQAVTSNDTIDTFAEVISYVATHGEEFSELVGEVDKNTKSVETLNGADNVVGSVDYKIKNAIANENLSQYATDSELKGVSDRVRAIESDYATDTDFTNLNNQVQGMYTNAQIDSALSGKQPVGDYALNSDISELSTQVGAIDERVTALEEGGSETPSGEPLVVYLSIRTTKPTLTTQGKIVGATMVDWGDGSPLEDISQLNSYTHTYTNTSYSGTPYSARFYGNITEIGSYAFTDGMAQVVGVDIPNTVTTLGNYAFYNCYFNTRVTIPPSVKSIGSRCFSDNQVGIIECLGRTPPTLQSGDRHFPVGASLQIIVPNKYLEAYKTAWTTYASQIDSYALVSEIPENEDVSLPIATRETLGGVKVGYGLHMDESDGTINSSPITYLDVTSGDTVADGIDEGGIYVTTEEIEVEQTGADGYVTYTYPTFYNKLPIVAGDGISIAINENNVAVISSKLLDPNIGGYMEMSGTNITSIGENGITLYADIDAYDGDDNSIGGTRIDDINIPIVAGEGISITKNSNGKAEISADGLATESYVDTKVANLVNSAPETLNTLSELATAIQNHEDEYDALLETVGNKANKSELSAVAFTGNYQDLDDTPVDLQDASIIFTSAPLEIRAIDEYGIHINLPEIEIEKIDGSYNYCSGVGSIPIVAGSGISITQNDNGKAEITGTDIICYNLVYGTNTSANFAQISFSLPTQSADTPTTLKGINTLLRSMYSFYSIVYPATGALRNSGKVYTVCGIAPASSNGLYAVIVNTDATSSGSLLANATWAPLADNGTTTVYAMRNGLTYTNQ